MNLEQKQSPFWWTQNHRTVIYFLRELTGVVIGGYFLLYILIFSLPRPLAHSLGRWLETLTPLLFAASMLHALTWFWVTVKIAPLPNIRWTKPAAFILLLGIWILASYLILIFLYERPIIIPF